MVLAQVVEIPGFCQISPHKEKEKKNSHFHLVDGNEPLQQLVVHSLLPKSPWEDHLSPLHPYSVGV